MATTRPFAYNTGSTIDGTTQIGNIAIGVSEQDYSQNPGGVKWWMGPDEELGYVIANQVPTGDHPTPTDEDSYINFWRSTDLTEQSLLDLLNVLPITNGLEPFTNATEAKTWLNDNGHFTTYGEDLPTPTPTATSTPTPTPEGTPVPTDTPTPTNEPINHPYQIIIIGNTDNTGTFFDDLTTACSALDCLTDSSCSAQDSIIGYVDGEIFDYIYVSSDSNETVSLIFDGYYILADGSGLYFLTQFTDSQFVSSVNCIPSNTPTPTPTSGPTATPTPTPEMASLFIDIVMGYDGISFGGVTYTSDTTISVVKNQQYSITAFSGSGLFQNWEGTNVNLPVPNSSNTIVTITGDTATLKAVFPEMTSTPTPVPPTATPTPTATSTPTPTIDLSAVTTYTISGCSSSNVIVADLGPGNFFPGDTFFLDFTGSTASECYTIVNKIDTTPDDGGNPISSYSNCADCIDGTTTTYTISGCTTLNVLVADLGPGAFAAGDIFNMTFTGATPSGCYRIVNKIVATPTDTGAPLNFYSNCDDCEASLVTPTPTVVPPTATPTPTPTETPIPATSTPTPTPTTVASCSGIRYNLTDDFSGPPTSGNTLWIKNGTPSASNEVNRLAISTPSFINRYDSDGIDRLSYFSNFTGNSFTMTVCQDGNTAIYSGITGTITYNGIDFFELDATKLSITQSSPVTAFTFNQSVYYNFSVPGQSTPTPTPTSTTEPTNVPTDTPTPTPDATSTPEPATETPAPTGVPTDTPTPTPTSVGGGIGEWYFYSDEGNINAGPPTTSGNAQFIIQGSPVVETYNPNKSNGVTYLAFNLNDSTDTNYNTQFTNLVNNGGTISITQGGNTVTYVGVAGPSFFIDPSGFFVLSAQACTQTVTSASPFVFGTPISLSFS